MNSSKSISEQDQEFVNAEVAKLMERFDSVRIFVTRHDGGQEQTSSYENGGGNFYAQLGQIREFLSIQDQYQRNWAIRKDENEH